MTPKRQAGFFMGAIALLFLCVGIVMFLAGCSVEINALS